MAHHRLCSARFFFQRVIWPTYDTYCDIGLTIYCLYHGVTSWGVAMLLPILSNLLTSISAYVRMRRAKNLLGSKTCWSVEGLALPLLVWPQIQASRVGRMMWKQERGWKQKKRQFERDEGSIESILEGVTQCFVTALIIVQKYVEEDEQFSYRTQNFNDTGRESFGVGALIFLVISCTGSLVTGILGIYNFLVRGPLKMTLDQGIGNGILLLTIIIYSVASRFGSLTLFFLFASSMEPQGFKEDLLAYSVVIMSFTVFQLVISLIPLMTFGPKRFFNLIFSFPHILIVPLVTPFTFGLTCNSGCCCHCCCCCGCSKPRLALSRSLSLVNHTVTLLLMIPPVIFFDFISSWDMGAAQLCIAVLGLLAAPILLFQPDRINMLGVLDPDNVQQQFLAKVKGGGCVFRLGPIKEELPLPEDDMEEENEQITVALQ